MFERHASQKSEMNHWDDNRGGDGAAKQAGSARQEDSVGLFLNNSVCVSQSQCKKKKKKRYDYDGGFASHLNLKTLSR